MILLSKSLSKIQAKGKSVEEALQNAISELGVTENQVSYTIIEEPSKGFLGIGSKDAVVEVELLKGGSKPIEKTTVTSDVNPAQTPEEFLSGIFGAMGMEVDISSTKEDNNLNITLTGDDMGIVIGKRGDTLDSLQYLTSLVVNKDRSKEEYTRVTIDTEGYRQKREDALKALSERLANKVARTGKKYTLEPMNPYERRIIHANLQNNESVTTFSIGEEPYRKVVIAPKNDKRRSNYNTKKPVAKKPAEALEYDEDLPMTYPGGGQVSKTKVSSFEEYLEEHKND